MAAVSRRESRPDYKAENAALKARVKELETEVSTLKTRLNDLRKAKNTTILKREREVINVCGPVLGQRRESTKSTDCDHTELEKKLAESEKKTQDLLRQLTESRNKSQDKPKEIGCDHEDLIVQLKFELKNLEGDKAALVIENEDLAERCAGLLTELSLKEAKWCEKEEEYNQKLKQQWGEKYREWMEETEKKIFELQQANALLRTLVRKGGNRGNDDAGTST